MNENETPKDGTKQLGRVRVRAVNGDFGETKGKDGGSPKMQIGVDTVITACDAELERYGVRVGMHVPWYGFFTTDTEQRTLESLRYFGCTFGPTGTDVTDISGLDANEVEATIEENTYKGETSLRLGFIDPIGGGVRLAKRLDESGKAQLRDRMQGLLAKTRPASSNPAGNGAKPPAARAPAPGAPGARGGSDIPF